jgi:hypothetical protein
MERSSNGSADIRRGILDELHIQYMKTVWILSGPHTLDHSWKVCSAKLRLKQKSIILVRETLSKMI